MSIQLDADVVGLITLLNSGYSDSTRQTTGYLRDCGQLLHIVKNS